MKLEEAREILGVEAGASESEVGLMHHPEFEPSVDQATFNRLRRLTSSRRFEHTPTRILTTQTQKSSFRFKKPS